MPQRHYYGTGLPVKGVAPALGLDSPPGGVGVLLLSGIGSNGSAKGSLIIACIEVENDDDIGDRWSRRCFLVTSNRSDCYGSDSDGQ